MQQPILLENGKNDGDDMDSNLSNFSVARSVHIYYYLCLVNTRIWV